LRPVEGFHASTKKKDGVAARAGAYQQKKLKRAKHCAGQVTGRLVAEITFRERERTARRQEELQREKRGWAGERERKRGRFSRFLSRRLEMGGNGFSSGPGLLVIIVCIQKRGIHGQQFGVFPNHLMGDTDY